MYVSLRALLPALRFSPSLSEMTFEVLNLSVFYFLFVLLLVRFVWLFFRKFYLSLYLYLLSVHVHLFLSLYSVILFVRLYRLS